MTDILEFSGDNRWLSNFWPSPVWLDGLLFPNVEAAYVASKTTCVETRRIVQRLKTPSECKKFGRSIKLRDDWESVKIEVMRGLLRQKFTKPSVLAGRLINTGNCQLIEGNYWGDTFWGVCRGTGENWLGKLLMEIRAEIQNK